MVYGKQKTINEYMKDKYLMASLCFDVVLSLILYTSEQVT